MFENSRHEYFQLFFSMAVKYLRKAKIAYNLPRHFGVFDNAHIPAFTSTIFYKQISWLKINFKCLLY